MKTEEEIRIVQNGIRKKVEELISQIDDEWERSLENGEQNISKYNTLNLLYQSSRSLQRALSEIERL